MISIIVAMAKNRIIGRRGRIPWHLPADRKWFYTRTLGKPVIVGRRTWERLPVLKDRREIVLTRSVDRTEVRRIAYRSGVFVNSAQEAIDASGEAEEIMVIGGQEVYELFLPLAERIYLTVVDLEPKGDRFFPILEPRWVSRTIEPHAATAENPHDYVFEIWERQHEKLSA